MHEQLSSDEEVTSPTEVEKVRVIETPLGGRNSHAALPAALLRLRDPQGLRRNGALALLAELVPEYVASLDDAVVLTEVATA